jgi:hypothetical protein
MAVGDKIRTVDYNTVQTRVANVLGTGSGSLGYGQTVQSSQVTTSNNVTVNEWGSLRNDIINIYRHQNNSIPDTSVLPEAIEGASVRYNVSDAPVTVWDSLTSTLETNRINALPVGRFGTSTASGIGTFVSFANSATAIVLFKWDNSENARFFFNSGGRLRVTTQFSPTLFNSQNTSWQATLNSIGYQEWGGFYPDTSTSGTDGRNFYKSDGSYRQFYTSSASSPYGSNNYNLDAAKFTSGSQYAVGIRTRLVEGYTNPPDGDPDNPPPGDLVQGTLILYAQYTYPAGAMTGLGAAVWTEYQPISVEIGNYTTT